MTTPFWLNDPTILFNKNELSDLWPNSSMSVEQKLNAISRLVIILTLLGFLVTRGVRILITGAVTLAVIVILYKTQKHKETKKNIKQVIKEGFTSPGLYKALHSEFTTPTADNPAMNVLLPEINDNPTRKAAAPGFNAGVEKEMNDSTQKMVGEQFKDPNIDERLFKDLGDNFIFDQSMRTFHPTANTQIPNDQQAFAEFCYGDMISCKEGNGFACMRDNPRWTNY